jgi:hypothetical protein
LQGLPSELEKRKNPTLFIQVSVLLYICLPCCCVN